MFNLFENTQYLVRHLFQRHQLVQIARRSRCVVNVWMCCWHNRTNATGVRAECVNRRKANAVMLQPNWHRLDQLVLLYDFLILIIFEKIVNFNFIFCFLIFVFKRLQQLKIVEHNQWIQLPPIQHQTPLLNNQQRRLYRKKLLSPLIKLILMRMINRKELSHCQMVYFSNFFYIFISLIDVVLPGDQVQVRVVSKDGGANKGQLLYTSEGNY